MVLTRMGTGLGQQPPPEPDQEPDEGGQDDESQTEQTEDE